jgi:spore cortex formation protein SpoVR/YcgB (stage V sporulation)
MTDIVEKLLMAPHADFYRPSKWFELMKDAADEIERLRAALQRIDGINDNPACFNPMIEEVLRRALEPKTCA